jgi:hypothetical protein
MGREEGGKEEEMNPAILQTPFVQTALPIMFTIPSPYG